MTTHSSKEGDDAAGRRVSEAGFPVNLTPASPQLGEFLDTGATEAPRNTSKIHPGPALDGTSARPAADLGSLGPAKRVVWQVVTNRLLLGVLLVLSLACCFTRQILWLILQSPAGRDLSPQDLRVVFANVPVLFTTLLFCSGYHWVAPAFATSAVQRDYLRRLKRAEVTSVGLVLLIAGFAFVDIFAGLTGVNQPRPAGLPDPRRMELLPEVWGLRNNIFTGAGTFPCFLVAATMFRRSAVAARVGQLDGLSPHWLKSSFALSVSASALAGVVVVLAFVMILTSFPSIKATQMGDDVFAYDPVLWWSEVGRRQVDSLLAAHPETPGDVALFVEHVLETSRPVAFLVYARILAGAPPAGFNLNPRADGWVQPAVEWVSPEQAEGRVRVGFTVEDERGVFVLSIDRAAAGVSRNDALLTAVIIVYVAYIIRAVHSAVDVVFLSPLEQMQDVLRRTAAMIDHDGNIVAREGEPSDGSSTDEVDGRADQVSGGSRAAGLLVRGMPGRESERLTFAEATRRILKLVSRAAAGARGARKPPGTSFFSSFQEGSLHSVGGQSKMLAGSEEGDPQRSSRAALTLESVRSKAPPEPKEQKKLTALRMTFPPEVVNHAGTLKWPLLELGHSHHLQACNFFFVKMRIPEKFCRREAFVAWAQGVLEEHPGLPFHCAKRAVGALNAAVALVNMGGVMQELAVPYRFALLVAALGGRLGSVGWDDADLVRAGHPLALTYYNRDPQASAALAQVARIESREGCGVFSQLDPKDRDFVMDLVGSAIRTSQPWAAAQLAQEVSVFRRVRLADLVVDEAEEAANHTAQGRNRRSHSGPGSRNSSVTGPSVAATAPELFVRVVSALAQHFHLWGERREFRAWSERAVLEIQARPPAGGGEPSLGPGGEAPTRAQAVAQLVAAWERQTKALMVEAGRLLPQVGDLTRGLLKAGGLEGLLKDSPEPEKQQGRGGLISPDFVFPASEGGEPAPAPVAVPST